MGSKAPIDRSDYEQGFLDAIEKVLEVLDSMAEFHSNNAQDSDLTLEDQEQAINCALVLGQASSSLIVLGSKICRKEIEVPVPILKRHWWSES